jgi:hypothetical protein
MRFDNFETLMGFKPRLDLLGAENHEAPDMSKENAPAGIESPSDDPKRPSAQEINRGLGKGYEKDPKTEVESVPHEDESVEQSNSNLKDKSASKKKQADGIEMGHADDWGTGEDLTGEAYTSQIPDDSGAAPRTTDLLPEGARTAEDEADSGASEASETIEHAGGTEGFESGDEVQRAQEEYAEKFMVGAQLADIKIASNLLKEVERYGYIHNVTAKHSLESLQELLNESRDLYESMSNKVVQASQGKGAKQAASLQIPRVTPAPERENSEISDLAAILSGTSF